MNKKLILAVIIVAQIASAQVSKNVADFNKLKVFDKLKVELISSSENKIIVSGINEIDVEIVDKNGELKIKMPFLKLSSVDDISIKLYFKKIENIEANEGSYIFSEHSFKQKNINLKAKEGAQINLNIEVENATIKVVSGGVIDVSGAATNQKSELASGGTLFAKELITSQTTIDIYAGGKAEIFAKKAVDAKVQMGGSVYIFGKPKEINKETTLGGTIIEK